MRIDQRALDQLREVKITRNYTRYAEGSVLVEFGHTKVLCTASIDNSVPRFLKGQGQGWVTAEYGMLPRSTHSRCDREAARGKQTGRTQEIQLIHIQDSPPRLTRGPGAELYRPCSDFRHPAGEAPRFGGGGI